MAKAAKKRTKRPTPKPVNKVKDAAIPSPENITEMATNNTGTGTGATTTLPAHATDTTGPDEGAATTTDTPATPNPTPPEATTTTKGGKATSEGKVTYTVSVQFNDKSDFSKVYPVGTDVSHFDQNRLDDLVNKGHVKKA